MIDANLKKRALNVLTIFSDCCTVKFVCKEGGEVKMLMDAGAMNAGQ